jgi:LEA14-like dessication related protein
MTPAAEEPGRMRVLRIAVLTFVTCLATGCASLGPKIEAPKLSVVRVGMVSADIFSQQFRVRVHVANPNDRAIPVKAIEYELFLQGDSFAEGTTNAPFTVPALGETEFDMMVRTNFVSSIGRLLSRLETSPDRKLQYEMSGKVYVDLPFIRSVPFSDTGIVDLDVPR